MPILSVSEFTEHHPSTPEYYMQMYGVSRDAAESYLRLLRDHRAFANHEALHGRDPCSKRFGVRDHHDRPVERKL